MKPPKNFYSNLDRMKQGFPEVPAASAADAGKIITVGSDGSYKLAATVKGILTAGSTTITLSDDAITSNSKFDFYTSIFGINPISVTVATGSITLIFESQAVDVIVEVEVR